MPSITAFKGSDEGQIVEASVDKRDLQPDEVLLKITHSGLCGTDVHYKNVPMVLGHEGVGEVQEIGSNVTLLKKGDRAGFGYNHSSCLSCAQCLSGNDIFCPQRQLYGEADLDQGSMASHAVWKESFLFKIPESISSEDAAPLQCGGITVYTALQLYPVKAGERVGVLGVGGLGHLAIQFAAKMGCEVVVFSGSDSKEEEAIKLGAKEFYATKGATELKLKDGKGIDRLLVTSSAQVDWNLYLSVINPRGAVYPLSVSSDDLRMPYMPLILNGIRVQGSVVGSRGIHREMLEFAAAQNIKPIVQLFPMSKQGIEDAFQALEDGKMRYRGVLVAQ
ncbi:hypothetical protein LTR64_007532 [Lithohypha guttulata]|uniref:Enoyl reductase (ER) domain-containing protein n=1 Tax=Lithohypha guttulata TaxID=1690604 RepID=A0AAN7SXJ2_9EURO|nr:hypothetical protein LTR51_007042 [Lithohypha guttulata]KAK5084230.1 hypothetical protein LTR05_005306 [Lithohypha guttulata]